MKTTRFLLTTGLTLATAFTLSCSGDDGKDGSSCIGNPTNAGIDIICGGKSVGVLPNGTNGTNF